MLMFKVRRSAWGWLVPQMLAHHVGVFALDEGVVVGRRGRDFVSSPTCSLFSSAATRRLMYSEPLSAWKPITSNGNRSSSASRIGTMNRSEMAGAAPTCSYCVTSSTTLTTYTPLRPSLSPMWTVSTRRKPGRPFGSGALRTAMATGLGRVFSQVVRLVRQSLEARIAMDVARAAQDLAGRQRRHPPERLVHLRQQPDVRQRVPRLERPPAVARPPVRHHTGLRPLSDQPADLRRREPARLADVRPPPAAPVGASEKGVVEPHQRAAYELVRGPAILGLVGHRLGTLDEGPNLLHCAQALGVKCHDHPPSVEDSAPFHAHIALDSAL